MYPGTVGTGAPERTRDKAHDRLPEEDSRGLPAIFRRMHQTTVIGGGGITVVQSTTARGGSRT
ncbi:hypothetical protein MOX01_36580 [Microbacterium oxydans]|nr:hypothetical protein MOX01_36580 [Microbacterium oxydans]